jgi:hypothetical protein
MGEAGYGARVVEEKKEGIQGRESLRQIHASFFHLQECFNCCTDIQYMDYKKP